MVSFETMIMMMNEGMHKEGILSPEKYITGTEFIAWLIASFVVIVVFDRFFFDEKYNTKSITRPGDEEIVFLMMGWEYIFFSQYMLYRHKYEDLLIMHGVFISFAIVLNAVATKKEFEGMRRFLAEKLGWLF